MLCVFVASVVCFCSKRYTEHMYTTPFASTLRRLRQAAGHSQQHVATHLGIARATYASLETSRREPTIAELRGIAALYKISLEQLLAANSEPTTVAEPSPAYQHNRTQPPASDDKLQALLAAIARLDQQQQQQSILLHTQQQEIRALRIACERLTTAIDRLAKAKQVPDPTKHTRK